jgi:hypothetical protein
MANTLIQLKHSTVTNVPPSLNIAEPAYSYTSNTLFIGTSDGLSTINIGGQFYTSQIDDATNLDLGGTIVRRDSDGSASFNVITANTITAEIDGNANTATQLETPRFFNFTGDVDNVSVSFNGTANADFTLELTNTGVTAGTYGGQTKIPTFVVDEDGRITSAANVNVATTLSLASDGSTTANVDLLSETLVIAGGDGVTTTANDITNTIKFYLFTGYEGAVESTNILNIADPSIVTATIVANIEGGTVSNLTSAISVVDGGTGANTFSAGSIVIGNGTGALQVLANTTSAGVYANASHVPVITVDNYGRVSAVTNTSISLNTSQITSGILGVARGGTGANTFTNNGVLLGQGTSAVTTVQSSTEGHVLTINSSGVPTFTMLSGGTF